MCLLDLSMTEATQAQLNHGPIVENLGGRIGVDDRVLKMRHQHEVSGLEPVVVNGMMIDVTQNSLCPEAISGIIGVDELAQSVHDLETGLLIGVQLSLQRQ